MPTQKKIVTELDREARPFWLNIVRFATTLESNLRHWKSRVHWYAAKEVCVFRFGGPDCRVCRLIRVYLLVAIPVLMMMWIRPDFQIPKGIDGRAIVGYTFAVGVVLMVAYKYYTDIYRKKRKWAIFPTVGNVDFLKSAGTPDFRMSVRRWILKAKRFLAFR